MSVVTPRGFRAAGVHAGIKASGALDLSLVVADRPAGAAAVFTTSLTAAPPVVVSRERIGRGTARAVIVNSGSANAGTGREGISDAVAMAAAAAHAVGAPEEQVLVCSTGPIGGRLPVERIREAVPVLAERLGTTADHGRSAAEAMMTTDTVPKLTSVDGGGFSVGGIAKGAAMLRPDMATMLAILTTDAAAGPEALGSILRSAVATTFNCLDVDGCQSTNDTVVLLASGASGASPPADVLGEAVTEACRSLALQMAQDAEGASKVVRILVDGAASFEEARRLGTAVADSALVRSSFYGADPNWGRVFGALGAAGVPLDPSRVDIAYDGVPACRGGVGVEFDEEGLSARLEGDFTLEIGVGDGPGRAEVVTTDLTPEYVRFNGERS